MYNKLVSLANVSYVIIALFPGIENILGLVSVISLSTQIAFAFKNIYCTYVLELVDSGTSIDLTKSLGTGQIFSLNRGFVISKTSI